MRRPTIRFSAWLPALLAAAALAGFAASARAVPIRITYTDGPSEGFNDPVLGPARRAAIEAAASNWASRLQGTVPIDVSASMDPMDGSATWAVLGGAYATEAFDVKHQGVLYPAALANQIAGRDLDPNTPDIVIQYNSDVDGPVILGGESFYYGTDGRIHVSSDPRYVDIDFYQTCFHELGHGLGFFSGIGSDGTLEYGLPMVFDTFVTSGDVDLAADPTSPKRLTAMTAADRATALVSNALYFSGPNARRGAGGVSAKLFAPTSYQAGSSTSHLDDATYYGSLSSADLNECMTPYLGPGVMHHPGPIVCGVFEDIGWSFIPYTHADAVDALSAVSGLQATKEGDVVHLKREGLSKYPGALGMADALRDARAAAGTDTDPPTLGTK